MMLFKRNPSFGKFQSLKKSLGSFSFLENMKQKLDKKDLSRYADFGASLLKAWKIQKRFSNEVTKKALRVCSDIIQSKGYQKIPIEVLLKEYRESYLNIIAICGCQTSTILENRVRAGVNLNYKLSGKTKFLFLGARPNLDSQASIPNEAYEMQTIFYDLLHEKNSQKEAPGMMDLILDTESTDTRENVQNMLNHVTGLSKDEASLPYKFPKNVFVVSSTFHQIKIAETIEELIEDTDISISNKFYLVGAESANKLDKASTTEEYTKSLFYQLLKSILENDSHLNN